MKKLQKTFIALILFSFLIPIAVFSQTFIRYNTWTGASGCNIFSDPNNASTVINVPCTVNDTSTTIPHLTAVGQPTYDNANKTINLASEIKNGSQNQGTEYRITVNFKQGYFYKITITAARIMSQQTGANVLLRTDLNNGGSGSNNQCNGSGIIDANGSGNLKKSIQVTNSSFSTADTNYVYDYPSLLSYQTYLMIAAIPPAGSVYQTVLVRRIKIEETPPAVSFNITPASVSLACGSTSASTFTVNTHNSTGITVTGYTWNLGATPNGWLLSNGTGAPATYSTGTTNTLTLTPVCGAIQKNVSATVAANGSNYNTTNAATVSITQPSLSISGNSSLCSGYTSYLINGLPCNASILWTAPPAGMGSLSSLTSSPTTLTYGGTSGNFTLTANVTSCGASTPVTLPVHVGSYTSSDYSLSSNASISGQPLYWCPNQSYTFTVSGASASNYNWAIPFGWQILYNSGNMMVAKSPSTPGALGQVTVSFIEPCGSTISRNIYCTYSTTGCSGSSVYTITPNPASSYITIACASLQTYCNIAAVQIIDLYGQVKSSQTWSYTNQQVQMPVYFLTPGTYIAKIYDGIQWYSVQFVKQ